MTTDLFALRTLVMIAVGAPLSLLVFLGAVSLTGRVLPEKITGTATRAAMTVSFFAVTVSWFLYFGAGAPPQHVSFGTWFGAPAGGFELAFLIDGMSIGFAALSAGICGIVAAFSHRYLHREPGYNRYFVLLSLFATGILLVALAGSIEVLFAGWELLGLSSALLVAFFHERRAPVVNAMRVFVVYRFGDAALLTAAVLLHHWAGSGSLVLLFSGDAAATTALGADKVTVIAVLLIAAVAAKSALLPFSTWLPRAMEGPTPSSAVFYGALSVHAGCYLLLRAEPLLAQSTTAQALALLAGVTTALFAAVTARVQTDIKSSLAYASLTQVGIIVAEIALGWTTLAFVHIVGHASFRLLQLLAAPNVLHDLHQVENAVGHSITPRDDTTRDRFYLAAVEAGFLDAMMERFVLRPFAHLMATLDALDRRLVGRGERRDD